MQGVFIVVVAGGPRLGDLRAGALASADLGGRRDGVRGRGHRGRDGRRRGGGAVVLALPRPAVARDGPAGFASPREWRGPAGPAGPERVHDIGPIAYRTGERRVLRRGRGDHRQVGDQARRRRRRGRRRACAGSPRDAWSRASTSGTARPRPRRRPPGARPRPGGVQGSSCPRSLVIRKDGEISALAAVAPRQTTISGLRTANSASSHGRHARRCSGPGVWWIRRLPFVVNRKCFTALVT